MVEIVWYFDLQLPIQLASITTKVVSSNASIQHYAIKFVSFLRLLRFAPPIKLTATIQILLKSGVKYHNPNPHLLGFISYHNVKHVCRTEKRGSTYCIIVLLIYKDHIITADIYCQWRVMVFNNFQQYFSYIVAVSFIGGGYRSIRRKPPTCHKSLTNFT